jgi:AcrR family transcriptional regulator
MSTSLVKAPDSRQRFIDAAVQLFIRHSFAGTSLQMIADEVGVTKAAVYHHFHTREELLKAVVDPLVDELRAVIEAAESLRGRHPRADRMLTGFVDIVVSNQGIMGLLAGDPGVSELLRSDPQRAELINRQIKLLTEVDTGPGAGVKAAVVMSGIGGALRRRTFDLDDEALRQQLVAAGRRILGLRAPRP